MHPLAKLAMFGARPKKSKVSLRRLVPCPICGHVQSMRKLHRHIERTHGSQPTESFPFPTISPNSTLGQRHRYYFSRITPLLMMLESQVREASLSERSPEAGRLDELVQKCVREIPSLANDPEIVRATKLLHKLRRCGFLQATAQPFQGGAPGLGRRREIGRA